MNEEFLSFAQTFAREETKRRTEKRYSSVIYVSLGANCLVHREESNVQSHLRGIMVAWGQTTEALNVL